MAGPLLVRRARCYARSRCARCGTRPAPPRTAEDGPSGPLAVAAKLLEAFLEIRLVHDGKHLDLRLQLAEQLFGQGRQLGRVLEVEDHKRRADSALGTEVRGLG